MSSAGTYIHIPFCRSRCSYCNFATGIYEGSLAESYVQALVKEILSWHEIESPDAIDTIYFGGGTPSLLSASQIELILTAIHARFATADLADIEVTMEMNPGTVTPALLREFHRLGITRASFGAQTFDNRELARLGRSHTAQDTRQTFTFLRDAGFDNVSFDLIAGLPGQTLAGWERNVDQALALRPEHLSFYLLEVHEGTPLAEHIRRGMQPQPDDDLAAQMFELMLNCAGSAGYEHYEISNLCLPGFESRHNTKYWTGASYYGFGCSAHSYDGNFRRWSNERDVARYTDLIQRDAPPVVERMELSKQQAGAEALFLGLRMTQGVDLKRHHLQFGADVRESHGADLARFRQAGLIEFDGDLIKLTRSGTLLSNEVFAVFV
ncbi:radical SAM family heme chaperone HemW [soil metagenome]